MAKGTDIARLTEGEAFGEIQSAIMVLRGKQVLLDFQLAAMYGVPTKALNQAVKRNINRFPEDFMFRLEPQEAAWMRSQFVTTYLQDAENQQDKDLSNAALPEKRRADALPYAFTEQGVAMLSSVLRSETAVQVNIAIMRAFVMARQIVTETRENSLAIEELRTRMRMLEDALENNLEAVNDLSEETRVELENIYNAIGALSAKVEEPKKQEPLPRRFIKLFGSEITRTRNNKFN